MMAENEQVTRGGGPDGLVQRLAERLGASARAETIFGPPIEREGITVVPVARARWGFGGGSVGGGSGADAAGQAGGGGGGGLVMSPVGYVEIKGGEARFRRIVDPAALLPLVLATSLGCLLVLQQLRRLLRPGR